MSWKLSKNSSVKNILIITLSNIGDVVLTCPSIDILCQDFPSAKIWIVVGPKAVSLFEGNPRVHKVLVYDKHASLGNQVRWLWRLWKQSFELIVDFRHTMMPFFIHSRYHTPLISPQDKSGHRLQKHSSRLKAIYDFKQLSAQRLTILPQANHEAMLPAGHFVVIAPGAADAAKRWPIAKFAVLSDFIVEQGLKVVFVGDHQDVPLIEELRRSMKYPALSLAGAIHLRELAFVLQNAKFAVTHDSGAMHLASYFNVPLIALWGPTDMKKYGPWSSRHQIIINRNSCPRCRHPKTDVPHQCMDAITVEEVINAVKSIQ